MVLQRGLMKMGPFHKNFPEDIIWVPECEAKLKWIIKINSTTFSTI
jgi:hypothetical protein